jgi:hypothetical protein
LSKQRIVAKYARLWPREVFDITEKGSKTRLVARGVEALRNPGVYILYRNEIPYYIGKTTKRLLFKRLHDHANKSTDRYFNFWNYFSVFVVPGPAHVDEVEGILIASMPTANSAAPRIERIRLPREIAEVLRDARKRAVRRPESGTPNR